MARIDSYLGKLAGDEITPKPPVSRLDKNLNKIAESGGGGGGSDGFLVVHCRYGTGSEPTYVIDHDYAAMKAAIEAGQVPVVIGSFSAARYTYTYQTDTGSSMIFQYLVIEQDKLKKKLLNVYSDGRIVTTGTDYALTASYS